MLCEYGERLARAGCSRCDDAAESQLMGGAASLLAGFVVADRRCEVGSSEARAAECGGVAQVEYPTEAYPAGDEIPGPDHGGGQAAVEIDIDEMPVCLDHHRVRRSSQVENLELAAGSPSSARRRAGQRADPRGCVPLEDAVDGDRVLGADACGRLGQRYIAPWVSDSTASMTSLNPPWRSTSMGRRPPKCRLREWSQISAPSGV